MNADNVVTGVALDLYNGTGGSRLTLGRLMCRERIGEVIDGNCDNIFLEDGGEWEGPYWAGSSETFTGGSGSWIGPAEIPGTRIVGLYFNYSPDVDATEAEKEKAGKHEWTLIDFDQLSDKQLVCAEKQLERARTIYNADEEKMNIIRHVENKVMKAKGSPENKDKAEESRKECCHRGVPT